IERAARAVVERELAAEGEVGRGSGVRGAAPAAAVRCDAALDAVTVDAAIALGAGGLGLAEEAGALEVDVEEAAAEERDRAENDQSRSCEHPYHPAPWVNQAGCGAGPPRFCAVCASGWGSPPHFFAYPGGGRSWVGMAAPLS